MTDAEGTVVAESTDLRSRALAALPWVAVVVLWPLWLGIMLAAGSLLYVGLSAAASNAGAPIAVPIVFTALASTGACLAGAWWAGRVLGKRATPDRLWMVPAAYAALAAAVTVGAAALDVLGGAWPPTWTSETIVGVVVFASMGVVPVLAALAFRTGWSRARRLFAGR